MLREPMIPIWYSRLLARLIKLWAVFAVFVTAIIAACVLVDWLTPVGWGYPWYSLPVLAAIGGFAGFVYRASSARLRQSNDQ
jgi:hypothetical protein